MKKSLVSKLLAVALSAAMLVGLTACGGSAAPAPASEPAAAVEGEAYPAETEETWEGGED